MDEKKIKQIISNNIDLTKEVIPNSKLWSSENTLRVFTERCIKTAIQEFLKDLWHDASEEPRMFAEVVAEAKITESINTYISFKKSDALFTNWTAYSHGASITRWLYIDDLFPKQKGGSK